MSHDMNGNELTRTLRERADEVVGHPAHLRRRARPGPQIRRRRAGGDDAGLALVAAVVLPISLLSGDRRRQSDPDPGPPAPPAPSTRTPVACRPCRSDVIIYQDGPRVPLQLRRAVSATASRCSAPTARSSPCRPADGAVRRGSSTTRHATATYPLDRRPGRAAGERSPGWTPTAPRCCSPGPDEPRRSPPSRAATRRAVAVTGDCADLCSVGSSAATARAWGRAGRSTARRGHRGRRSRRSSTSARPAD